MACKESICRNCFHSYVCEQFNENKDDNNEKCHFFNDHYVPRADVAPKIEVASKIIREVERILEAKIINIEEDLFHGIALRGEVAQKNGFEEVLVELAELKKKYTEGE